MHCGIKMYNLFPRLLGIFENWPSQFPRIKAMGFDYIYINPIQLTGSSNSLYSIKNYFEFNPIFISGENDISPVDQVKNMLTSAHEHGLKVIIDLVLNHTAIDSELVYEHPDWFCQNNDGSIVHPEFYDDGKLVTLDDLAQIDNANSPDKDNLWDYWLSLIRYLINLGFDGFKCDSAYKIPQNLWIYLIERIKATNPQIQFLGDTLGCAPEDIIRVAESGFDYIYNSSKWWDFKEDWFLREYKKIVGSAPSISFPESHDTERISSKDFSNENLSKIRYAFAALFSTGVMMPMGYEFGFKRKLDVVNTTPADLEKPNFNLSDYIKIINDIKSSNEIFNEDNMIEILHSDNNLFIFTKYSLNKKNKAMVIINLNLFSYTYCSFPNFYSKMGQKLIIDISPYNRMDFIPETFEYHLAPGEVRILTIK